MLGRAHRETARGDEIEGRAARADFGDGDCAFYLQRFFRRPERFETLLRIDDDHARQRQAERGEAGRIKLSVLRADTRFARPDNGAVAPKRRERGGETGGGRAFARFGGRNFMRRRARQGGEQARKVGLALFKERISGLRGQRRAPFHAGFQAKRGRRRSAPFLRG